VWKRIVAATASHLRPTAVRVRTYFRDLSNARTYGLAAELAFWLFFSLIPLALVAGMVGAKFALGNAPWLDQLLASVPVQTRDLIRGQLTQVAAWNGGTVSIKAGAVFLWIASSGIHAIFELLELKTGSRRPWWKRRLLAIATCLGLSVGVALLAILATGIGWIEALVSGALPHIHPATTDVWNKGLRITAGFATYVGLSAGLYRIGIPRTRRRSMPVLPGAVLAVVAHVALGTTYILYLSEVGIGGAYQASLAVIGVTLIALYIFALALLMGAQLNCTLATWRAQTSFHEGPIDEPHC
jgi:membrane protein